VVDRLRERIVAEPWVRNIASLTAVYIGPSRLLVNVRLVPIPELARRPAEELIERAYALRADLCAAEVIMDAEIMLVPESDDSSST
jgi:hypothetical protein